MKSPNLRYTAIQIYGINYYAPPTPELRHTAGMVASSIKFDEFDELEVFSVPHFYSFIAIASEAPLDNYVSSA